MVGLSGHVDLIRRFADVHDDVQRKAEATPPDHLHGGAAGEAGTDFPADSLSGRSAAGTTGPDGGLERRTSRGKSRFRRKKKFLFALRLMQSRGLCGRGLKAGYTGSDSRANIVVSINTGAPSGGWKSLRDPSPEMDLSST